MSRQYAVKIRFQGYWYVDMEKQFDSEAEAVAEGEKRFSIGGAVQWEVETLRKP